MLGEQMSSGIKTLFRVLFLLSLTVVFVRPSAVAQPASPIGAWFCSVVKEGFEPAAAIQSFPLEKLPAPQEARRFSGQIVHVEYVSEGDDFSVEYSYSFNENDVSQLYGFNLTVDSVGDYDLTDTIWLMEFGQPSSSSTGYIVTAGRKDTYLDSAPFYFEHSSTDRISANWFYEKDIKKAAAVCANATEVPPDTPRIGDETVGPAVSKYTDPVSVWFCRVLTPDFDPIAAFSSFPLETMPSPQESRTTEEDVTYVEYVSEGSDYTLQYRYALNESDLAQPYGFMLSLENYRGTRDAMLEAGKWLRGYGTPIKSWLGFHVGSDPDDLYAPGFSFGVFKHTGARFAEWFHPADIKQAATYCK